MNVQPIRRPLAAVEADVLAIGLFDGDAGLPAGLAGTPLAETLGRLIEAKDLPEVGRRRRPAARAWRDPGWRRGSVVVFGLGPREKFDAGRGVLGGGRRRRRSSRASRRGQVAVVAARGGRPGGDRLGPDRGAGRRHPGARPPEDRAVAAPVRDALDRRPRPDARTAFDAAVRRGEVVGEAVNLARDLANTPAGREDARPPWPPGPARSAEAAGLTVEVWDEAADRARSGSAACSAWRPGSDEPPAFVDPGAPQGGRRARPWPWSARG